MINIVETINKTIDSRKYGCGVFIDLKKAFDTVKSLIDNIFLNTLEYNSISGNITIQLSDHFQFVILEGFFKDLPIPKLNIYQRNFKYFNEREFKETLNGINWDNILSLNASDPNLSMNNFYNQINILLDEVAPYKKLTKKEIKLKSKPWITIDIQHLMQKRDKLHTKYCQEPNKTKKEELYLNYKKLRNKLTKMSVKLYITKTFLKPIKITHLKFGKE